MTEVIPDRSEVFRVMNKFQEEYGINDKQINEFVDDGLSFDVMKLLIEPPENCTSCSKNTKKEGQITIKQVPQGMKFDYLCNKCLKKNLDGPTKCTIQKNKKGETVYHCPHCLLERPITDTKFFKDHNCLNISMTRDFAKSLTGGK